jgi:hypothetical protein
MSPVFVRYSTLLQKLCQMTAGLSGELLHIQTMHNLLFL